MLSVGDVRTTRWADRNSEEKFAYTQSDASSASDETPESLFVDAQTVAAVRSALRNLPSPEREVMADVYPTDREPKSIREMAAARGESFTRVRNTLLSGQKMLRDVLSKSLA